MEQGGKKGRIWGGGCFDGDKQPAKKETPNLALVTKQVKLSRFKS
jgi:hypothetical protein